MARNDPDSWAWHEDSFKLDSESPLVISRSLWDELSQNESDTCTLFSSTPATDITEAGTMHPSLSHQDYCGGEQCSPRQKRRRLLFFSGIQHDYEGQDVPIRGFAAENPTWDINSEDSVERSPEHTEQQTSDCCWMETYLNDSAERNTIQVPFCQTSQSDSMQQDFNTPPVRPVASARRPTSLEVGNRTKSVQKVASPVAYPFALLKPCGASGDVTLDDINARIQTPRAKQQKQKRLSIEDTSGNLGAGLSGKNVVALTKIHTEGNGSITIMRTKG